MNDFYPNPNHSRNEVVEDLRKRLLRCTLVRGTADDKRDSVRSLRLLVSNFGKDYYYSTQLHYANRATGPAGLF